MAHEFLLDLAKSNHEGFESIRARIRTVAQYEQFENKVIFRHVGDQLFEFKGAGVRLYAFYDTLPGLQPQLIIATNGGSKNNAREQNADIARAKALKRDYEQAKGAQNAKIKLLILSDEN